MKSPSNWINLQDYLGVNQEMGQDMAGKVAGQVGEQAKNASDQLQSDQANFNTAAKNNQNAYNPDSGADAAAKASQGYSGPTSLGGMDPGLEGQIGDAVTRVKNAATQSGQETELGQAYKGKTASGGLDSFLLSGQGAMADLQNQYGTLDKTGYDANEASIATGQAAKAATAENQRLWGEKAGADSAKAASAAQLAQTKADSAAVDKAWGQTNTDNWGHQLAEGVSLGGQIFGATQGGKKDPIEKYFQGGHDYGNIAWSPADKDVFSQMDAAQWNELDGLRSDAQKRWIQNRARELKTGKQYDNRGLEIPGSHAAPRGKFQDWQTLAK